MYCSILNGQLNLCIVIDPTGFLATAPGCVEACVIKDCQRSCGRVTFQSCPSLVGGGRLVDCSNLLPSATVVAEKLYFHRCLFVHGEVDPPSGWQKADPPAGGHCSRRYATYWNAFLFTWVNPPPTCSILFKFFIRYLSCFCLLDICWVRVLIAKSEFPLALKKRKKSGNFRSVRDN